MYRNSPFQLPQTSHKDNVISSLKRQLAQLHDYSQDFFKVNEQIRKLQNKYSLILQEKERSQKEHKHRTQLDKKTITEIKGDIDKLKLQIYKYTSQIEDTLRENGIFKRLVDNKNNEIDGLVKRNAQFDKRNDRQNEQNKKISCNIKQLKDQKNKLESECERIHSLLDNAVRELKDTEKQIKTLDEASNKLDKNINQAQKDNKDLLVQIKGKQNSISKAQKSLQQLTHKTQSITSKNQQLQSNSHNLQDDIQQANSNLSNEMNKHKQLNTKLKNIQTTIRATQDQLSQVINKKDALKDEHFELISDNKQLNTDIDTSLINILQFQKLNEELQKEIENYIETDQEARKILDRKNVMKTLLDQVNSRLEQTSQQIAHLR